MACGAQDIALELLLVVSSDSEGGLVDYREGQIIVAFKNSVTEESALNIIARVGLSVIIGFVSNTHPSYLIKVEKGAEEEWIKKFAALPEVAFAEKNGVARTY